MDWNAEEVARILHVSKNMLVRAVESAKEPFVFGDPEPMKLTTAQMEEINALKIPGVFGVERKMNLRIRLENNYLG